MHLHCYMYCGNSVAIRYFHPHYVPGFLLRRDNFAMPSRVFLSGYNAHFLTASLVDDFQLPDDHEVRADLGATGIKAMVSE